MDKLDNKTNYEINDKINDKINHDTNYEINFANRSPKSHVNDLFVKRWSPRSFKKTKFSATTLSTIIDAARWSPSCFNEQPWLFVTATQVDKEDYSQFLNLLNDKNQTWAKNASVLGFIFARRNFSHNDKANDWSVFDCGSAWMAMTLQARMLGLYTHGMAGIEKQETYRTLNISENDYEIICGFALGVIDTPEKLSDEFQEKEVPSERKPLSKIWQQGSK